MPQRLRRLNPLIRIQRKTLLQQINKQIEVLRLRVVHARRRTHQARAQVAGWLDDGEGLDCGLHVVSVCTTRLNEWKLGACRTATQGRLDFQQPRPRVCSRQVPAKMGNGAGLKGGTGRLAALTCNIWSLIQRLAGPRECGSPHASRRGVHG